MKPPRAPKRMVWARLVEFWHAAINTALRHETKSFLREAARGELVEHAARYITTAPKNLQDSIKVLRWTLPKQTVDRPQVSSRHR